MYTNGILLLILLVNFEPQWADLAQFSGLCCLAAAAAAAFLKFFYSSVMLVTPV